MRIKRHQDISDERLSAIQTVLGKSPILNFLKVEVELLKPGFARIRIPFRREFVQGFGVIQGGIIATAGDTATGIAFFTLLEPAEAVVTVDLKINYLSPVKACDIMSESRIIHKGSTISVGEFEVRGPEGNLVAKGITTLTSRRRGGAG